MEGNGAIFSDCGKYRYALWRIFPGCSASSNLVNFIMLNPSTADADKNDPTVARCEERAKQMGYDGLIVTNLFAYRSTDPTLLNKVDEPEGIENDSYLVSTARDFSSLVVCGWGGSSKLIKNRADFVVKMLRSRWIKLNYLRMSKSSGQPWHPLYLPYSELPKAWN